MSLQQKQADTVAPWLHLTLNRWTLFNSDQFELKGILT